jgi:hypothetical protein
MAATKHFDIHTLANIAATCCPRLGPAFSRHDMDSILDDLETLSHANVDALRESYGNDLDDAEDELNMEIEAYCSDAISTCVPRVQFTEPDHAFVALGRLLDNFDVCNESAVCAYARIASRMLKVAAFDLAVRATANEVRR